MRIFFALIFFFSYELANCQLPLEWVVDYKGDDFSIDTPYLLESDSNDNYYSVVKTGSHFAFNKYNSSNSLVYSNILPNTSFYSNDKINDLCIDNYGNVIAIGEKSGDLFMIKIDTTGAVLWEEKKYSV